MYLYKSNIQPWQRSFDLGAPGAPLLNHFMGGLFFRVQDNCVQVAIQQATLAGSALCFANNHLRSSSAHQHPVISIHNNPAASEMWKEAGGPSM